MLSLIRTWIYHMLLALPLLPATAGCTGDEGSPYAIASHCNVTRQGARTDAHCQAGLVLNQQKVGEGVFDYRLDFGNDVSHVGVVDVDAEDDAEDGQVRLTLDEPTGKVGLETEEGDVRVELLDETTWQLRATTWSKGASMATERLVTCPEFDRCADELEACARGNPNPNQSCEEQCRCAALAEFLESSPVYVRFNAKKYTPVRFAAAVAKQEMQQLADHKAAVIPILGAVFMGLAQIFQSDVFKPQYDPEQKAHVGTTG